MKSTAAAALHRAYKRFLMEQLNAALDGLTHRRLKAILLDYHTRLSNQLKTPEPWTEPLLADYILQASHLKKKNLS